MGYKVPLFNKQTRENKNYTMRVVFAKNRIFTYDVLMCQVPCGLTY